MLIKWVRWLPYWLVMKILRNQYGFNGYGTLKLNNAEYKICYFQVNQGEFVCFLKELQEIFDKRKKEKQDNKLDKKLDKLNEKLDKNYWLKEKLKKQFEDDKLYE